MNLGDSTTEFFIGWDVGAWNCDNNSRSRDAIVILDAHNQFVGQPWGWKNLREQINAAATTKDWLESLFRMCRSDPPVGDYHVTMAIDTPLGFSTEFVELVKHLTPSDGAIGVTAKNPYLFRQTERYLLDHNLKPLSPLTHMIGNQATKGMHVLAKFASEAREPGIWTDGGLLTVIEAYPASCKRSMTMRRLRHHPRLARDDLEDALTCAMVAFLFGNDREKLAAPAEGIPSSEGWIWVPADALHPDGTQTNGPRP